MGLDAWTRLTNSYNLAGEVTRIGYNESTPWVTLGYDRRGRLVAVTNGTQVGALAYNDAGQLVAESYSAGPLAGLSVTNTYDALLRRANQTLNSQLQTLSTTSYGYDLASRLSAVTNASESVLYAYLANSPLVESLTFKQSGTVRLTTSKSYDNLNRLASVVSSNSQLPSPISHAYAYNAANQRTAITNEDNAKWLYGYDALGQVTSGKKYWSDGTIAPGQQFEYGFDDIGNRQTAKFIGDQSGTNLRVANYTNNNLNQLTGRGVPGYVNVMGAANANATVTVNRPPTNNPAPYRKGEYFQVELTVTNSAAVAYMPLTNVAVLNQGTNADLVMTNIGYHLLAKNAAVFVHDADGNLGSDGLWTNAWDAEGRLIAMTNLSAVPTAARRRLEFTYDYLGRRIQKIVSTNTGSAYVAVSTNKFLYDGWNLIAELNHTNAVIRRYTWGTDLSGTMQGAGGVGGLLMVHQPLTSLPSTNFVASDGNGNVSALTDAATGAENARYEYGPFGELIRASGPQARNCPIRFSTKYQDDESELLYYGFRYYSASAGRWWGRDAAEERGGLNLYRFADNTGVNAIDDLGLGVMYMVHPNGSTTLTYTAPPKPSSFLQKFLNGDGNTKKQRDACKSICDELKKLLAKAYVAKDVYENRNGLEHVPGAPNYERLSNEQISGLGLNPELFVNAGSGFYAGLYQDHGSGEYLIAFRGTEPTSWGAFGKDAKTDAIQFLGLPDAQYNSAAELGRQLGVLFPGQVSSTGHSLGGGLSRIAAVKGNFPAVNFNAAGVNLRTAQRLGLDLNSASSLATSYNVPGEIVSYGFNRLLVPDNSQQVALPHPGSGPLPVHRHFMESVIAAIHRALIENGCK